MIAATMATMATVDTANGTRPCYPCGVFAEHPKESYAPRLAGRPKCLRAGFYKEHDEWHVDGGDGLIQDHPNREEAESAATVAQAEERTVVVEE